MISKNIGIYTTYAEFTCHTYGSVSLQVTTVDDSVNFHGKVYLHFLPFFLQKMKKNLSMEIIRKVPMDLLSEAN